MSSPENNDSTKLVISVHAGGKPPAGRITIFVLCIFWASYVIYLYNMHWLLHIRWLLHIHWLLPIHWLLHIHWLFKPPCPFHGQVYASLYINRVLGPGALGQFLYEIPVPDGHYFEY